MLKLSYRLSIVTIFIFLTKCMADVPLHGIQPSKEVQQALDIMSKSYTSGSLAKIFSDRKKLRDFGIINSSNQHTNLVSAKVPLLLGHYSNSNNIYSTQEFNNQIFQSNPNGTMSQYYNEISNGQFILTGTTNGWYSAPSNQAFYVETNHGMNGGGARFARDLAILADATIDFSQYDADNDGYVDALMIVHTGPGAETGANDNIWSHRWRFNDAHAFYPTIMPQGEYITNDPRPGHPGEFIKINDYIIQPELISSSNTGIINIGVFCHEFGHILGLPDLYDTDYSSAGVGNWCLMAFGSYGGDRNHAEKPTHMSAWCKEKLGWISPVVVTSDLIGQQIQDVEQNQIVYKLWTNGIPGQQYFLIENRQQIGYDQYIPLGGLLIWHIDNARSGNSDESHKLVDLEEADGLDDLDDNTSSGDAGDVFPGSTNKTIFNSTSTPNSKDYSSNNTQIEILNVSLSTQIITSDLKTGLGSVSSNAFRVYNDGTSSLTVTNIVNRLNKTWLSVSNPTNYTIQPGSYQEHQITINWSNVSSEDMGILDILSSDPLKPSVPETIKVIPNQLCNLSVSGNTIPSSIPVSGGNYSITVVSSSCSWSITSIPNWVTASPLSGGNGNTTVNVTVQTNSSCNQKTGNIDITYNGNTTTISLIQQGSAGSSVVCSVPNLEVAPGSTIQIPLKINPNSLQIGSFDATVIYNPDFLTYISSSKGACVPLDWSTDFNGNTSGRVQIGAFGTTPLSASCDVVLMTFTVPQNVQDGQTTTIELENLSATDVNVNPLCVSSNNGTLTFRNKALLSGTLRYFKNSKLLSADTVSLVGVNPSLSFITVSDNNGNFLITDVVLGGNDTLTPSRISGNFTQPGTITSADALKAFKGRDGGPLQLATYEKLAAGVTTDCNITSADALAILKRATGTFPNFRQFGKNDWRFVDSSFILTNDNWCLSPMSRYYYPMTSGDKTSQSFIGIIYGDVDGSYGNTLLASGELIKTNSKRLTNEIQSTVIYSIPANILGLPGDTVIVPLNINPSDNSVGSFDCTISFDTAIARYLNYSTSLSGWNIDINGNNTNGTVNIGAFISSGYSITSSDTILHLKFLICDSATLNSFSNLELSGLSATDPDVNPIEVRGEDGKITVGTPPVDVKNENNGLPSEFLLGQNFPNPFNPSTTINFQLPTSNHVTLKLYNVLGKEVAILVDAVLSAGYKSVQYDASKLSSGVYTYRLTAGDFVETKRMVLLK